MQIYADVKDLIDFREKMRYLSYHVPDLIDMQLDNLLIGAYTGKMELLFKERYRKILEGAFLKEDLY